MDFLDNLYLNANLKAYHFNRDAGKRLNETNPGLGLEYEKGDLRTFLGQYKNSIGKKSRYGLLGYTPLKAKTSLGDFSAGVIGGGITGYGMPLAPALGLLGTYQKGNFGLNLTVVPSASVDGKKAYGFAGLQARYKLK